MSAIAIISRCARAIRSPNSNSTARMTGRSARFMPFALRALEASTLNPRGPVEKESHKRGEQPDAGPIKPITHTEPPSEHPCRLDSPTSLRKAVLRKALLPEELMA
jgi:hypothetical protein